MAVIKRRPVPSTGDLIKKEEKISEAIPRKPRVPIHEAMKLLREEFEMSREEENIEEIDEIDNHEYKEIKKDSIQESNKSYDLEKFHPASSKTTSRSNSIPGVMSVVNTKGGKRVVLSKDLMDKLNNPTNVAMSFSENSIAIGVTLPNNNNQLTIKTSGKKGIIYSSGIISEITDKYGLDFNNRTSITFSQVDYIEAEGSTIAIINAKQANQGGKDNG